MVVADDNTTIKGLGDIRGKRAGENLTSNWADVARSNGAQVVGVDSMDLAIQNLRQGSVDDVVGGGARGEAAGLAVLLQPHRVLHQGEGVGANHLREVGLPHDGRSGPAHYVDVHDARLGRAESRVRPSPRVT